MCLSAFSFGQSNTHLPKFTRLKFTDFELNPSVVEGIESMGFEKPTPIQEQAIPHILLQRDMIACAQTGTGKTGAFLIPILHMLADVPHNGKTKALIVVPTRELAIQIDQQVQGVGYFANISSLALYGGNDSKGWDTQKVAIEQGVDVLVATPGRLLSHLALGYVDFSEVQFLVLDEADRMLDMGFLADITTINETVPNSAQRLLFSATMPDNIRKLSKKILKDPTELSIAVSKPAENILQAAYMVYDNQKISLIESLMRNKQELKSVIIFVSAKKKVDEVAKVLSKLKLNARAIHSDLEQSERESVMLDFRNRKIQILVATDIVARGIDVTEISLVINFDVPSDPEDYIHRVGRTARAEASGVALTLITPAEQHQFGRIEQFLGKTIHKIQAPAELGPTPVYDPNQRPPKKFSRGGGGAKKKFFRKDQKRNA